MSTLADEPKPVQPGTMTYAGVVLLAVFHAFVIVVNGLAFFILLLHEPWYYSFPICTFLFILLFGDWTCPLTKWENQLRARAGYLPLQSQNRDRFIGHYLVSPVRRLARRIWVKDVRH